MRMNMTRLMAIFMAALALMAGVAATAAPTTAPAKAEAGLLPWSETMKDGLALAQMNGKPVLVRAGASWCGPCRQLDGEIAKPAVQQALVRWTLIYIDTDLNPTDARQLGVMVIPTLRVMTSTGRTVDARTGYLDANELITWLDQHYAETGTAVPTELKADTPPDAPTMASLLEQFDSRDPLLREATIRRLAPHPDVAAPSVVKAFATGRLAVRLTALELLEAWKAPLDGLDPWQPESLSAARLEALAEWAAKPDKVPATQPASFDDLQLATARKDLAAYLKAPTPAEVRAVRERLARYGPALLPEVLDRLKTAETDAVTERLSALRYRLAASESLALSWPDGFERLAAMSATARQQAVEELTRLAGPDDVPLLLELFAHPDPLVREIALRAMQNLGGEQTVDALVKLLHDPEPNVRAAVLKQLAEKPNRALVPKVAEYVKTERDADLIVHAVRFLREVKGPEAVTCLTALLTDESWRVRAEAAEALTQSFSDARGITEEQKADVYVALVKLLDDPEGFVVHRAMEGLKAMGLNLAAAMEPLARAASKHPELATEISAMMAGGGGGRPAGLSHLRKFISSPDPSVRAAAITGLASSEPLNIEKELLATLQDSEASVRLAAAGALLQTLEKLRPSERNSPTVYMSGEVIEVERRPGLLGGLFGSRTQTVRRVVTTRPGAEAETQPATTQPAAPELDPQSKWLVEFRAGRGRAEWLNTLIQPLDKMLTAPSAEERVAAAVPLAALGADERALPVLMVEAINSPEQRTKIAQALPWLPWERRVELFNHVLQQNIPFEQMTELATAMAKLPDPRAGEPLWELLNRPEADGDGAAAIYQALCVLYFGEQYYFVEGASEARREVAASAAKPRAAGGTSIQRVAALAILLAVNHEQAAEAARAILADPTLSGDAQLRRDAGQILLLSDGGKGKAAIEALSSDLPELRQMAVTFLAFGAADLQALRGGIQVYASIHDPDDLYRFNASSPIQPKVPVGLKAEAVRPLLQDTDPKVVACAAYLLAVLGQGDSLPMLVEYWRTQARADLGWMRLVYRAVAALGDDANINVLEEIYPLVSGDDNRLKEFYWTVRIMKGPEALKFREKIRRDVGTSRLR